MFLDASTQLYMRLCPSARQSVRRSVGSGDRVEKWGNWRFRYYLCMFEYWGWVGVWMGVGCPCPPVHNDIVTPRHLFNLRPSPLQHLQVPGLVSHAQFWSRYFFKLHQMEEEEKRRAALKARAEDAVNNKDDGLGSWGDDEDGNEEEEIVTPKDQEVQKGGSIHPKITNTDIVFDVVVIIIFVKYDN